MVKRKRTIPEEPKSNLHLTVTREEARDQIQARIDYGESLLPLRITEVRQLESLLEQSEQWSDFNKVLLLKLFSSDTLSKEYNNSTFVSFFLYPTHQQRINYAMDKIKCPLANLRSIVERLVLYDEPESTEDNLKQDSQLSTITNKVFIVHGHDESLKQTVARMLVKLDLEPVILHEKPNSGKTIIEKFEKYADVSFAVILLTPDDEGREKSKSADNFQDRARQNVILELGYFMAKLGRENVAAIHKQNIEIPTDVLGVLYIECDGAGRWEFDLAKEMKAAGLSVDSNKLL